jgi:hypothetical protein
MSEVVSAVTSMNWWLMAIAPLVLCYAALALVALGYIDGRWAPRTVIGVVAEVVGGLLWLPIVIAWLCYQVVRVLLRVAYAVVMFFFDIGDTEAAQYNRRQRAVATAAREDGLPF